MFPLCHVPQIPTRQIIKYDVRTHQYLTGSCNHRRITLKGMSYNVFESKPDVSVGICRFNLSSSSQQNELQIREENDWKKMRRRIEKKYGIDTTENSNNRNHVENNDKVVSGLHKDSTLHQHQVHARNSNKEQVCAICLESLSTRRRNISNSSTNSFNFKRNELIELECSHSFHKQCITQWRIMNYSCPVCRHISTR